MKKRTRFLQPWEQTAIRDAYLAGEKVAVIALEFGVHTSVVRYYGRKAGAKPRPPAGTRARTFATWLDGNPLHLRQRDGI